MHDQLSRIVLGSIWEHTKNKGMYTVLFVGRLEATQELVVVYRHVCGSDVWVRPLSSWVELRDNGPRQRFEWRSAP